MRENLGLPRGTTLFLYCTLLGVEQLFCSLPLTNWKQEQLP